MKRFFLYFYFGNLAAVFLVGTVFAFVGVPSALAYESSGWKNFGVAGDYTTNFTPDFSCGGEKSLHSWKIMDERTGQLASVEKVYVEVRDLDTGKTVASSSQTNVSETSALCYDPTTQYFFVGINGGANYYDCGMRGGEGLGVCVLMYWEHNPDGTVTPDVKNKRIVGNIYVRPKSFTQQDKHHVSPIGVNGVPAFLNSDPSLNMELRDFPSNTPAEGALTPSELFVTVNKFGGGQTFNKYSISKKGPYTKGPFELTDGWYYWDFGVVLAGNGAGLGSSWAGYELFLLDRVAPVVSASILPVSPTSADTVTISGTAQDVLSGLLLPGISVYIDGISTTCAMSVASEGTTAVQTCPVSGGPYLAGTMHSYYAVAKDRAGNVGTSTIGSFTVAPGTLKICPSSATISKGGTGTLRAWYDSAGSTMDCGALPSAAIDKTSSSVWSSNNTSFVTVNGGTVTGVNIGSANIRATYPGTSGDTVKVDVICIETVTCDSEQNKVCSGKTVPAGTTLAGTCGTVNCSGKSGTRTCDYNWKELAP